jgi:hypothetical protein
VRQGPQTGCRDCLPDDRSSSSRAALPERKRAHAPAVRVERAGGCAPAGVRRPHLNVATRVPALACRDDDQCPRLERRLSAEQT